MSDLLAAVTPSALFQTLGRLHVLVVHFPIALIFVAGMIEGYRLIKRRKDGPSPVAGTCLGLGATAAVLSVALGLILKGDNDDTLVLTHQWIGIAAAVAACVAAGLVRVARREPQALPLYRVWILAVTVLVAVAGHYGGAVTHGETYLTELLFPAEEQSPTNPDGVAAPVRMAGATGVGKVDFVRDVQPILAASCYSCHGPDKRKGALRLDSRPLVLRGGSNGPALVPGDAGKSLIIQHVLGANGKKRMPVNADPLKPEQIATLRAWIDSGAHWPDAVANEKVADEKHWAFVKPTRPAIPAVRDKSWVRNPIDAFILARLEKEGLKPSPEADRPTLIRRASLDLIGLPPTPREVADFVNDPSPDAYEKVVDRLLASPQYGERWGRHWLDIARYADTNGYEKDAPRSVWAYRDWVIDALNRDLPYDQFVVEQFAGDMLPDATDAQRIATGFHRNTMFNEEGGIDVEEFRYKAVVDRVQTTATAFMGLTVHCAQCHDHKYDPISHKEYFSLFALLNNADEPKLSVKDPAVTVKRQAAQAEIDRLVADLESRFPTHKQDVTFAPVKPTKATSEQGATLTVQDDAAVLASGKGAEKDKYTLEFPVDLTGITDLCLDVLTDKSLPRSGPGRAKNGNFVLSELRAQIIPASGGSPIPVELVAARADYEQPRFAAAAAIDGNPETGWAIDNGAKTNQDRTITFSLKSHPAAGQGTLIVTLDQSFPNHALGRFRLSLGRAAPAPESDLPVAEQRRRFLESEMLAWESAVAPKCAQWTVLDPATYARAHNGTITELPDRSLLFTGDNYYREEYRIEAPAPLKDITAIRLEVLPHDDLENGGPGRDPDGGFLLSEFAVATVVDHPVASAAAGSPPIPQPTSLPLATATSATGQDPAYAIDGRKDTHWINFTPGGAPQSIVFRLKDKLPNPAGGVLAFSLLQNYHEEENLGRIRLSVTADPRPDLAATGLPAEVEQILLTPREKRSPTQHDELKRYYLSVTPHLAPQHAVIAAARAALPMHETTLVLKERPTPRTTRLHHRGEFLQPKDPVAPGLPAILPPLPKDRLADRLTFARWLVSPDDGNPLIGRVTMNRVWNTYFGRGLVPSVEDFGIVGEKPSHPELLDWLATELPRQRWSMKAMHRLIVTSNTYRQSSRVTPSLLAKDPQNVLLARGPRLRVEAEVVRDIALAASGLLSAKIGGPSVFPPQPDGVSELSYGPLAWKTSTGEDRYRRGLYTFLKRTALYPGLTTFDAPSAEVVCARRTRSNTPLQALTTLNDAVFVEAAQAMARRVIGEAPSADPAARVTHAFRLCLSRDPNPDELAQVLSFHDAQAKRFRDKPEDAAKVALTDPSTPPQDVDLPTVATWTTISRVILNLDETVTRE